MIKRLLWAIAGLMALCAFYYLMRPAPVLTPPEKPSSDEQQARPKQPSDVISGQTEPSVKPAEQGASASVPEQRVAGGESLSLPSSLPKRAASARQPAEEITGPEGELENVQFMVRGYRDALGENPVGNNAEITKALMGDNARQVKMPLPAGSHLNEKGELTDRWGTPYFFHQLSGRNMEIRSAGPDQQMWTKDDLLTR